MRILCSGDTLAYTEILGTKEVAKDAAAMVLADDNFATIVKAVENGRNLYQNITHAIQFLLSAAALDSSRGGSIMAISPRNTS